PPTLRRSAWPGRRIEPRPLRAGRPNLGPTRATTNVRRRARSAPRAASARLAWPAAVVRIRGSEWSAVAPLPTEGVDRPPHVRARPGIAGDPRPAESPVPQLQASTRPRQAEPG